MLRPFPSVAVVAALAACGGSTVDAATSCDLVAKGCTLEFIATTPDRDVFVLAQCSGASSAFYGPPGRVQQRTVTDDNRDSSIHLTFDLDGVSTLAQLQFENSFQGWGRSRLQPASTPPSSEAPGAIPLEPLPGSFGVGPQPSPDRLLDAGPAPWTRRADAELVAGLSFLCF